MPLSILQRPSSVYKNACLRRWNKLRESLTSAITGEVTFAASSVAECMYVDYAGWTALHKAAYGGAPWDVIDALVHTYPPALSMQTSQGWTPLNLACWREVHSDVVLCLLNNATECAGQESESGKTPLYCACAGVRTVDYAVLRRLVQLRPEVVLWKDNQGTGRSPLDLVCSEYGPVMKRVVRLVVLEAAEKHSQSLASEQQPTASCSKPLSSADYLSTVAQKYLQADQDLRDCWRKVSLLIQATAVGSRTSTTTNKNKRKRKLLCVGKNIAQDDVVLQNGLLHAFSTVLHHLCWDHHHDANTTCTSTTASTSTSSLMSQNGSHLQQCSSLLAKALTVEDDASQDDELSDQDTHHQHSNHHQDSDTYGRLACPDTKQLLPFLRFAVSLHPQQLEEVDENTGLTPFQSLVHQNSSSSIVKHQSQPDTRNARVKTPATTVPPATEGGHLSWGCCHA